MRVFVPLRTWRQPMGHTSFSVSRLTSSLLRIAHVLTASTVFLTSAMDVGMNFLNLLTAFTAATSPPNFFLPSLRVAAAEAAEVEVPWEAPVLTSTLPSPMSI